MVERDRLVARHAFIAERHGVVAEIVIGVDGGGQIERVREAEAERKDLFGMGGQQFGDDDQRMHTGDDTLGDVIDGIHADGPIETAHNLVGIQTRGVDVHRADGAHLGEQVKGGRYDIGYIAVACTVEQMGMILDVDKPQVVGRMRRMERRRMAL